MQVGLVGAWGGEHLALTVTERGGALEFDCAAGEISEPLEVDAGGRFEAAGVFIPGQGGPVQAGEAPLRRPARYAGRVVGQTMTLSLTLSETGELIGPFRLRKDAPPQLLRCL